MDARLEAKLKQWHTQLEVLREVEEQYLNLDGSTKALYSHIFLETEGKNIAEREAKAYASDDWRAFSEGLAAAHSKYNHERRKLELYMKAYEAEYLTMKLEAEAIKRAG